MRMADKVELIRMNFKELMNNLIRAVSQIRQKRPGRKAMDKQHFVNDDIVRQGPKILNFIATEQIFSFLVIFDYLKIHPVTIFLLPEPCFMISNNALKTSSPD